MTNKPQLWSIVVFFLLIALQLENKQKQMDHVKVKTLFGLYSKWEISHNCVEPKQNIKLCSDFSNHAPVMWVFFSFVVDLPGCAKVTSLCINHFS